MAGQASDATAQTSQLALAAYLDDLVAGRRVLWLGDGAGEAADRLARSAESVMVLAPNPPPKDQSRHRAARISALRPGPLSFRPGSFDVLVVPSLDAVGLDTAERIGELRDVLDGDGVLVAGTPADDGVGYEALFELLADAFDVVRMVGQAPFTAWTLVDLEAAAGDYDVTFDGSLVEEEPRAERWLAVAGSRDASLDAYCVVQVEADRAGAPDAQETSPDRPRRRRRREEPAAEQSTSSDALAELESRVRDKQAELDAANEHAEALETTLAERSAELEGLRGHLEDAQRELEELSALREQWESREPEPAGRDDGAVAGDYERLERGLAEQGAKVLELEREVERRGTLVRDLVEELRDLRAAGSAPGSSGGGGGGSGGASSADLDAALERAMAAEAARAEAQFQIDELMGRLASGEDGAELEALRTREAELAGTVRGLRSRIAEVEEMRELAEGRLSVVELDLDDQKRRNLELERELGELREQFELELVRARGEPGAASETDGDLAEREAALRASENHLSARVGTLSGQLLACRDLVHQATEERDHARADALRLTALVSSLQDRFDGAKRGYEARIAEMIHDGLATDESRRLEREVWWLRGERDGLAHRLADREASIAAGGGEDGRVAEAREERDRLRAELDRLRQSHVGERARVTDAEERARRESERADELTASAGAREALVTRLQMDLAQEEGRRQDLSQRLSRAEEENERLRGALLDASERVDEALDAEQRIESVETVRRRADETLRETRAVLATLADGLGVPVSGERREITAVGMESPAGEPTPGDADAELLRHRVADLEKQLGDQETLMRSLTAQIEERDDRVRALERRLEGSVGVEGDEEALQRELMELQERAARLSDELLHERKARRAAEASNARQRDGSTSSDDLRSLHERLGENDAELLLLEGQRATAERDLKTIRDACAQARSGLEELLGTATADGDPATAEKIGSILRLLNRF